MSLDGVDNSKTVNTGRDNISPNEVKNVKISNFNTCFDLVIKGIKNNKKNKNLYKYNIFFDLFKENPSILGLRNNELLLKMKYIERKVYIMIKEIEKKEKKILREVTKVSEIKNKEISDLSEQKYIESLKLEFLKIKMEKYFNEILLRIQKEEGLESKITDLGLSLGVLSDGEELIDELLNDIKKYEKEYGKKDKKSYIYKNYHFYIEFIHDILTLKGSISKDISLMVSPHKFFSVNGINLDIYSSYKPLLMYVLSYYKIDHSKECDVESDFFYNIEDFQEYYRSFLMGEVTSKTSRKRNNMGPLIFNNGKNNEEEVEEINISEDLIISFIDIMLTKDILYLANSDNLVFGIEQIGISTHVFNKDGFNKTFSDPLIENINGGLEYFSKYFHTIDSNTEDYIYKIYSSIY